MREELLDDNVVLEEDDYQYLKILQQYHPLLGRLAVTLFAYVSLKFLFLALQLVSTENSFYFLWYGSGLLELIAEGLLLFLVYQFWQYRKAGEHLTQQTFERNEADWLRHQYRAWRLLGTVALVFLVRFFMYFLF